METTLRYRGHVATEEELAYLRRCLEENPGMSRRALSRKVCLEWNWVQPNGALRDMVCRGFMLALHRAGHITLPPPRLRFGNPLVARGAERRKPVLSMKVEETSITGDLSALCPLIFRQVRRTPEEALFNGLMEQHHYLKYTQPVGEHLKYLVYTAGAFSSEGPSPIPGCQRELFPALTGRPVACLAWSSAPRHLGSRDRFIGWGPEARRRNIRLIAYNTRFLILPWVRVPHLASHLLGRMAKILPVDWQRIYHHPVHFLETFIEPGRFRGTCYRAANWVSMGFTTGRGKNDQTHRPNRSIKEVWGYPLVKDFRERMAHIT